MSEFNADDRMNEITAALKLLGIGEPGIASIVNDYDTNDRFVITLNIPYWITKIQAPRSDGVMTNKLDKVDGPLCIKLICHSVNTHGQQLLRVLYDGQYAPTGPLQAPTHQVYEVVYPTLRDSQCAADLVPDTNALGGTLPPHCHPLPDLRTLFTGAYVYLRNNLPAFICQPEQPFGVERLGVLLAVPSIPHFFDFTVADAVPGTRATMIVERRVRLEWDPRIHREDPSIAATGQRLTLGVTWEQLAPAAFVRHTRGMTRHTLANDHQEPPTQRRRYVPDFNFGADDDDEEVAPSAAPPADDDDDAEPTRKATRKPKKK